jgi:hypothetical protein
MGKLNKLDLSTYVVHLIRKCPELLGNQICTLLSQHGLASPVDGRSGGTFELEVG